MTKAGLLQISWTEPHSTPLAPVPSSKQRENSQVPRKCRLSEQLADGLLSDSFDFE